MAYKGKEFKRNPGNDAFVYCRYSSDAQRDVSIEQQKNAAIDFAGKHDPKINIVDWFEDRAKSGTSMDRDGLQDMLYQCRLRRPAYLLVWKLDRLSREVHDSFAIDGQLLDYGVELITIAEELPADMGMRYAVQGLYAAMAHGFIVSHRKNVMRGLEDNASKCIYNGVPLIGYKGKTDEKYHIDKSTAPVVKKIFREYADGKPLQKIANELNEAGIKTARGNKFTVNSLRAILQNRAFIGEYHWGKGEKGYIIPGGMPRIIDDELFEATQKRLESNKRGGKGAIKKIKPDTHIGDFWLTGHIFCGECAKNSQESDDDKYARPDNTMQGTSGLSHTGKRYYYYSCKNHRKHKCCLKDVRKEYVEGYVNYLLNEFLTDTTKRFDIANLCYIYYKEHEGTSDSYEGSLKNSIKDVDRRLKNILNAIEEGVVNEMTQDAMLRLQENKKMLEEELEKEQIRKKYALKFDTVVKYLDSFARNNIGKHAIFDFFVDKIIVFNDKIAVTFRYNCYDRREMPMNDIIEMVDHNRLMMSFVPGHENEVFGFPEEAPPDRDNIIESESQEKSDFFG